MFTTNHPASRSRSRSRVGPRIVAADRRRRSRLRDLCDEVLASYRLAAGEELFTERDRAEAHAMFDTLTGRIATRQV